VQVKGGDFRIESFGKKVMVLKGMPGTRLGKCPDSLIGTEKEPARSEADNHDITIKMMLEPEDDELMGLTGRPVELQFLRLATGYTKLKAEVAELQAWKESAIANTPPMQDIAKELVLPLGEAIHDKILPGIISLKAKAERLTSWKSSVELKAKDSKVGLGFLKMAAVARQDFEEADKWRQEESK